MLCPALLHSHAGQPSLVVALHCLRRSLGTLPLSSMPSSSPEHTTTPPQGATSPTAEATTGTPSAAIEPSDEDLSLKASLFVRYLVACLSGLRAASTVMGARTVDTTRT